MTLLTEEWVRARKAVWQARDQFQTERLSPEPGGTRNSPCGTQVQSCLLLGAGAGPSQGHSMSISPGEQHSCTTQPFSLSLPVSLCFSLPHIVSIPSWKTLSHSRFDGLGFGRLHQLLDLGELVGEPLSYRPAHLTLAWALWENCLTHELSDPVWGKQNIAQKVGKDQEGVRPTLPIREIHQLDGV